MPKVTTTISIAQDLLSRVDAIAAQQDAHQNIGGRVAVREWLEKQEDDNGRG